MTPPPPPPLRHTHTEDKACVKKTQRSSQEFNKNFSKSNAEKANQLFLFILFINYVTVYRIILSLQS